MASQEKRFRDSICQFQFWAFAVFILPSTGVCLFPECFTQNGKSGKKLQGLYISVPVLGLYCFYTAKHWRLPIPFYSKYLVRIKVTGDSICLFQFWAFTVFILPSTGVCLFPVCFTQNGIQEKSCEDSICHFQFWGCCVLYYQPPEWLIPRVLYSK